MDKHTYRRRQLQALVDTINARLGGRGAIAEISRETGLDASSITRMLWEEGKKGMKRIGEESMEAISKKYPSWLNYQTETGNSPYALHVFEPSNISSFDAMNAIDSALQNMPLEMLIAARAVLVKWAAGEMSSTSCSEALSRLGHEAKQAAPLLTGKVAGSKK